MITQSLPRANLSGRSIPTVRTFNGSRGSLLGELYDHGPVDQSFDIFDQPNDAGEWHSQLSRQVPHLASQDLAAMRRATVPMFTRIVISAPYSQAPFMPQNCEPIHAPFPRAVPSTGSHSLSRTIPLNSYRLARTTIPSITDTMTCRFPHPPHLLTWSSITSGII
jgi:hypothetical protein